jgi:hypothetical protein
MTNSARGVGKGGEQPIVPQKAMAKGGIGKDHRVTDITKSAEETVPYPLGWTTKGATPLKEDHTVTSLKGEKRTTTIFSKSVWRRQK